MLEVKIAYGNSRKATFWSNKTIDFDALVERLKTPIRTSETVAEYHKMPKSQRDEVKDKGGYVGGHLRENRRKLENVVCRSFLSFDLDLAAPEFVKNISNYIPFKGCYYATHSHQPHAPRVRILLLASRDMTNDEYNAVARLLAKEIGILDMVDPCSFLPHQLMYWPSVPADGEYLYGLLEGEMVDPDQVLGTCPEWRDCALLPTTPKESVAKTLSGTKQKNPLAKDGVVGLFCRTYSVPEAIDAFLSDVYVDAGGGRYTYKAGESTAGLVLYENDSFAYSHHATDPVYGQLLNAFDLVRVHKFSDADTKKSFSLMSEFAMAQDAVKSRALEERAKQAQQDFSEVEDWKSKLQYSKRTQTLENSLHNIELILTHDEHLKGIVFNELADGMEIKDEVPWRHPCRFWREADDAQLISYIDKNYGSFSQRNYMIAVTKVTDDRSFHPIREYLSSLPPWDGIKRVDTLLVDFLGAPDNAYTHAVTRKTLCAAVKRIENPGCKFDTMLVLNGPQGIGKSTLIAKLAGEWFSDSLNLSDTKDKTAAEKLQGYWILEIGELAGLRKAEVETLRSFLSRQNDIYRAAFGKRATPHLRQCVFFGTTNAETGYLRDVTGNRRFWPVETPGRDDKHSWDITPYEVDQVWAEVKVYLQNGERLYLDPKLESLAKEAQRKAMETDDREGLVREYLSTLLPENWQDMDLFERRNYLMDESDFGGTKPEGTVRRNEVSNMEIWCECFGKNRADLTMLESNKIRAILITLGWERTPHKVRQKLYGPQIVYTRGDVLAECSSRVPEIPAS